MNNPFPPADIKPDEAMVARIVADHNEAARLRNALAAVCKEAETLINHSWGNGDHQHVAVADLQSLAGVVAAAKNVMKGNP